VLRIIGLCFSKPQFLNASRLHSIYHGGLVGWQGSGWALPDFTRDSCLTKVDAVEQVAHRACATLPWKDDAIGSAMTNHWPRGGHSYPPSGAGRTITEEFFNSIGKFYNTTKIRVCVSRLRNCFPARVLTLLVQQVQNLLFSGNQRKE
jgi:hypothetical protein